MMKRLFFKKIDGRWGDRLTVLGKLCEARFKRRKPLVISLTQPLFCWRRDVPSSLIGWKIFAFNGTGQG